MKVIEKKLTAFAIDPEGIVDNFYRNEKLVTCPCCGNNIRYIEAVVSETEYRAIKYMENKVYKYLENIQEAVISAYGYDVQFVKLCEKLNDLKTEIENKQKTSHLKVIK